MNTLMKYLYTRILLRAVLLEDLRYTVARNYLYILSPISPEPVNAVYQTFVRYEVYQESTLGESNHTLKISISLRFVVSGILQPIQHNEHHLAPGK